MPSRHDGERKEAFPAAGLRQYAPETRRETLPPHPPARSCLPQRVQLFGPLARQPAVRFRPGERRVPPRPAVIRCDTLACSTLLAVARQRKGFDAPRCRLVLEHLDTTASLQAALHEVLTRHQLSDLKFAVLVVLFALDPDPVTPANLAFHTAASRPAITEAVDQLFAQQLVQRERDTQDRRAIYINLTDTGRAAVDRALNDYLRAAGEIAHYTDPAVQTELLGGYARLREGIARLTST